jgi:predicted P-loop ATPase
MYGLPVERHLMPIIMGGQQGSGKTTLLRKLIGLDKVKGHAMKELAKESDFKQIGDERVIDLWRDFILFIDEMSWSSKAEMSTIKYLMSADSMDRRRMHQNHTDNVEQKSTMIGTSNKGSVAELFYDLSGLRRFAGLYVLNQMDSDAINQMDWLALWQCVSPYEDDPILSILEDLKKMQEEERPKSSVECWLEDTDWYMAFNKAMRQSEPPKFDARDLFDEYHQYEEKYFPQLNTNVIVFGRELGRLSRLDTPKPYFKRSTNAKGTCWQWARDRVNRDDIINDPSLERVVDLMSRKNRY